ncbi:MAG: lysophospholipid acyltransferase family protein [Anaerolineae bacterium]|jgi:1-acyl-sn-glycerol-3-phosphate acyltransferase
MNNGDHSTNDRASNPLEMSLWYRFVRAVIGFVLRLLSRLEIEGLEHLPDRGPYLVAVNHLHWLDPPVLGVVLPYRVHVFAAEKWEVHWLLGPFFRSLDAIFVQRGEVDRKALRAALEVLKEGGVLGLAPEGTRSKTGALQRGRGGAAYMATRVRAPVVPVVITGQREVFPSLWRLRRAKIRVVFGPPLEPPAVEGKATTDQIRAFTEEIMYHLAAMLPPQYRGVYADVAEKRPDLVTGPAMVGAGSDE